MINPSSYVKKGSIFYLLRRESGVAVAYKTSRYIEDATLADYSDTLGPVPLAELSKRIPLCFSQVPPLLWSTKEWKLRGGDKSSPRVGDLIICIEPGAPMCISGGFYTDYDLDDVYKAHEFITWSSVNGNLHGFVFCSALHIDPDIISHVLEKL